MNDKQRRKLAAYALDLAAAAPWPENRRTYTARIPWWIIEGARADLEAAGVDWRQFKRDQEAS